MTEKTFTFDQGVVDALDRLKKRFNVYTDGAVIERALGIALVANDVAGDAGIVTLGGAGGQRNLDLRG
jgi:hypothetical protein